MLRLHRIWLLFLWSSIACAPVPGNIGDSATAPFGEEYIRPLNGAERQAYRQFLVWVLRDMVEALNGDDAEHAYVAIPLLNKPATHRQLTDGAPITLGDRITLRELVDFGIDQNNSMKAVYQRKNYLRKNDLLLEATFEDGKVHFAISDQWLAIALTDLPYAQYILIRRLRRLADEIALEKEEESFARKTLYRDMYGLEARSVMAGLAYYAFADTGVAQDEKFRVFARDEYIHALQVEDYAKDTRWLKTFRRLSQTSGRSYHEIEEAYYAPFRNSEIKAEHLNIGAGVRSLLSLAAETTRRVTQVSQDANPDNWNQPEFRNFAEIAATEHNTFMSRGIQLLHREAIRYGQLISDPDSFSVISYAASAIDTMNQQTEHLQEHLWSQLTSRSVRRVPEARNTAFQAWTERTSQVFPANFNVIFRAAGSAHGIKGRLLHYIRGPYDGLEEP